MSEKESGLQDSGTREAFKSGAERDIRVGKGRYDLISPVATRRKAILMEKGAIKYEERNWEKGMYVSRCLDSAFRHLNQFLAGCNKEDHLAHASFNIDAIMHFQELNPEWNDLPIAGLDKFYDPENVYLQQGEVTPNGTGSD